MALTFFKTVSKGLKLKFRKFFGLIPTFIIIPKLEGLKMVGREGHFAPILNRVNVSYLGEMSDF